MQSGSTLFRNLQIIKFIFKILNLWIKENANDPKYAGKSGLEDDFEKEYIRIINDLRKYGSSE